MSVHHNSTSIEQLVINSLKNKEFVTSRELNLVPTELHSVMLTLSAREVVEFEINTEINRILTAEGEKVVNEGSPEFLLTKQLQKLKTFPLDQAEPNALKFAFKNRWIKKNENELQLIGNKTELTDVTAEKLKNIRNLEQKEFDELKRRKLCLLRKENVYVIRKGKNFLKENKAENAELTVELMQKHSNKIDEKFIDSFKPYNFNTKGSIPHCGSLHPLMKIRSEFKKIFIEMGFSEMETNLYVESSFWNFDSLFQPQNHPSREAHDTFFLSHPETSEIMEDNSYVERVKEIHCKGHSYEWDVEEAKKNILRTHTTAVSSRYLYENATKGVNREKSLKLFSIDKVFRNETVDATHLAEFHQVEGLVLGENLSLGDLMGILSTFFAKLGLHQIKFKPAFNPYTEPSMEVFGYHEGLKRWIEIGNSGIFRPEMLEPMGYSKNDTVIAWGLSLERPAMIKYGLNNIRELVGHKVDLNFIRNSEIVDF